MWDRLPLGLRPVIADPVHKREATRDSAMKALIGCPEVNLEDIREGDVGSILPTEAVALRQYQRTPIEIRRLVNPHLLAFEDFESD